MCLTLIETNPRDLGSVAQPMLKQQTVFSRPDHNALLPGQIGLNRVGFSFEKWKVSHQGPFTNYFYNMRVGRLKMCQLYLTLFYMNFWSSDFFKKSLIAACATFIKNKS